MLLPGSRCNYACDAHKRCARQPELFRPAQNMKHSYLKSLTCTVAMAALAALSGCAQTTSHEGAGGASQAKPSYSGLAWVEGDVFLGVHDAKNSAKHRQDPRLSVVRMQEDAVQEQWYSFNADSRLFRLPSDLESISTLPQGQGFLLVESGQDPQPQIYHLTCEHGAPVTRSQGPWPIPVENVEASEVFAAGQEWYFIYAERAKNKPSTQIRWAPFTINPLAFGTFQEITYTSEGFHGKGIRPISAMAIDREGNIYITATYDPGGGVGPFRSIVRKIGRITPDGQGKAKVQLHQPLTLATLDGVKVEGLALKEGAGQEPHIYIGTDDEDFGGIVRPLPPLSIPQH